MTAGEDQVDPKRILVIEDDREIRHLLQVVLGSPEREVVLAGSGAEAVSALESGGFHLVVLDLILPDTDGRELLKSLRERPGMARLPIVVISTRGTPETRAACFALGADAFVEKPFNPADLLQDVIARLQRAAEPDRVVHSDELTGLLSRQGVLELLEGLPEDVPHVVLAAGLDHFHDLSERFGWSTAEAFVHEVAAVLADGLPEGVAVGRTGGGDFVAVVQGDAVSGAGEIAAAMVSSVRKHPLEAPDGETLRLTLSVGVAHGSAGAARDEALIELAERRAFRATEGGGNCVVAGEEEAAASPRPILIAEDDDITATILRHRLEKEGFEVVRYANGQDAYRGALEMVPALVLLDVKMPGMDGFELLERLRRTPSYARVPVVMLTSMGSETDVVRAFSLGADDYVHKPFSPSELVARLRRFLARGYRAGG